MHNAHPIFQDNKLVKFCALYTENYGNSSFVAISYGDPHFETFDGNVYTFNGRGEYWLVRVRDMEDSAENFNLQARLIQPKKQDCKKQH